MLLAARPLLAAQMLPRRVRWRLRRQRRCNHSNQMAQMTSWVSPLGSHSMHRRPPVMPLHRAPRRRNSARGVLVVELLFDPRLEDNALVESADSSAPCSPSASAWPDRHSVSFAIQCFRPTRTRSAPVAMRPVPSARRKPITSPRNPRAISAPNTTLVSRSAAAAPMGRRRSAVSAAP